MKVTIFGASGKTGTLVAQQAAAAGHTVTAFVHHRDDFKQAESSASIHIAEGDALDLLAVSQALTGQDAVIDCIGGATPYKHTDLESSAARTILAAMQHGGVKRLIVISMMGIGDSREQAPFWYEHLLMPTFLRGSTPDKEAMEAEVRNSGVDFVLVRPPILSDSPATGQFHVIDQHTTGHKITRADLASFLVEQLSSDTYLNKAVTVVNS